LSALAIDRIAEVFLRESLSIERSLRDAAGIADPLHNLGDAALHPGAYAQATAAVHEALAYSRQVGVEHVSALSLHSLALVCVRSGEVQQAATCLSESASLFQQLGDRSGMVLCLEGHAETALAQRLFQAAIVSLAAASSWRTANDFPMAPYDCSDHERVLPAARSGLKTGALRKAWAIGSAMSLQQALDRAAVTEPVRPLRSDTHVALTRREREAAALDALGFTNRGIADELCIAPATAALHVEHIRGKLGFHSRAQIAAWTGEATPPT
jgi:non-specific serine/threonine protein kinase